MYDSLQTAYQRDDVLARLGGLGYLAFKHGRDFDLTAYPPTESTTDKHPLELPDGWQIRAETPIHFFANGACSGGLVYLNYQGREFGVQLEPPFCEPQLL
jgi:general secretion pathway protein G